MSRKVLLGITTTVLMLALLGGMIGLTYHYTNLPERISQHETILLGQSRMVPGSQAALRVLVRDSKDASPLPGSKIHVKLVAVDGKQYDLYEGKTDASGTAEVAFTVPEQLSGQPNLVVETESKLGSDMIERSVNAEREYRVLLTSDKPIYQPGQVIHLRGLALSTFDLRPAAGQPLEFVIADGEGNKVFRQEVTTSDYGVASVDFQLAGEVNTGAYKITAVMGETTSEKTVTVERYVLPKFDVKITTERSFYLPGERVQGSLQANYFYGKPVAGAKVTLEGFTFDFERQTVLTLEGVTDGDGAYEFEFDLPNYLAGSDLEGGSARFYVQATVTDLAEHSETSNLSLPVSQDRLQIQAIPESGVFKPGIENILYVMTSYPDGTPTSARLVLSFGDSGQQISAETGKYGLAEVRYVPTSPYLTLSVTAQDREGAAASQDFYFDGQWNSESLILRPEKPVYTVGETMNLTVLGSQPEGTAYLDIVREGQTLSTRSLPIQAGKGDIAVDLSPDLYGTLEIHVYKVLPDGTIVRDTRLVVVEAASDLAISLNTGAEQYRPGDTAGLDVQVSDGNGSGVQSALGLAIVDESVFALAEQDPGFAKLYFLLEKELLEPKFDLHGYNLTDLMTSGTGTETGLRQAQESAAQASLAGTGARLGGFSLQANSHDETVRRAYELQRDFFRSWSKILYVFLLLIPLAAAGLSAFALHKEKHLARSLVVVLALAWVLTLALFFWPLGPDGEWVRTPMDRINFLLQRLMWGGDDWLVWFFGAGLVSLLVLIVTAIVRKDGWLGLGLGLIGLYLGTLFILAVSVNQAGIYPDDPVLLAGLAAYTLFGLAFLLRAVGFAFLRRPVSALAGLGMGAFLLVGLLPGLAMSSSGMARAANGGNMVVEEMDMAGPPVMAGAPMIEAPKAMPTPAAAPTTQPAEPATGGPQGQEPPRLRQYFPETMFWLPDAVTDENGALHLDVPLADSITTWRMTALASSQDGRLGSVDVGLRVFQDFFVDLDLPVSLTAGDEVSVPVGVFNYLPDAQTVSLEIDQSGWFELLDEPVKQLEIAGNDITVVYFRVRALDFGQQAFQVTASGSRMSDAIRKEVRVYPDGKSFRFTQSDRLAEDAPSSVTVSIPESAVPGTQKVFVKIYPGILSQVVEGLDSILAMPNGCFEQTSSTTYPDVLVLDYLRTTNQASPEIEMKAEEYVNLGYQRLLTFEVDGGGFSLFGQAPADRMLTAYGLQEFSDMDRVHPVDPELIKRTAEWLLSTQTSDGSWENDQGLVHESTWQNLGDDRLPVTAYIVWSLTEAGYGGETRTQKGLEYVREFQSKAEDPYVLALIANALVASDLQTGRLSPVTESVLDRLAGKAIREGSEAKWESQVATFVGSEGQTSSIETTALAAYAFLRAERYTDLANAALVALIRQKDTQGTWYTTQATVLSLKALIESVRAGNEKVDAAVTIHLNGSETRTVQVTPETFDVVQMVSFEDVRPGSDNAIEITASGNGNLMYQVIGEYYLPWDKVDEFPQTNATQDLVAIDVKYDRNQLQVDDTVTVSVQVTLKEGQAEQALIDLGLPPGFTVQAEDLDALVTRFDDVAKDYPGPTIERYELTGRQILVYVRNLTQGQPLTFSYRLKAKYPLKVRVPGSQVYDYYNPEIAALFPAGELVVEP